MVGTVLGIIYFFMECISRWVARSMPDALFTVYNSHLETEMIQSLSSLTGWSSFWMVIVGGLCGIAISAVAKAWWSYKWPLLLKASFGVVFVIWPLEFISGSILNNSFKLGIWDYGKWPFAIQGQIDLLRFPVFLAVAIVAIWIDDAVRHWILDEPRPSTFANYLKRVFTLK